MFSVEKPLRGRQLRQVNTHDRFAEERNEMNGGWLAEKGGNV